MNARTHQETQALEATRNLIAVWPDETWCAYQDIPKMQRDDDYQLMRVTRRGKGGEPLSYEWVTR
jgi:hypothetical protein